VGFVRSRLGTVPESRPAEVKRTREENRSVRAESPGTAGDGRAPSVRFPSSDKREG
jgi:hypothetical protein